MKLTILFFAVVLGVVVTASEDIVKEDFECAKTVEYKENECNLCHCSQGQLACGRMICPNQDKAHRPACEVGTAWNKDCKRCWCTEEWGTLCTTACHH